MKKLIYSIILAVFAIIQTSAQWVAQTSNVNSLLNEVFFIDSQSGFVIGEGGTILKTTNAGANWTQININYNNDLNAIHFVNDNYGWIVGSQSLILKTTDGGDSWFQQNLGVNLLLYDVFFIDENNGWIGTLSANAEVLRTMDGCQSWTAYPTGIQNTLTVYFTSLNNGWAGGWGGNLAKTTDGGITWELQSSGTSGRTKIFFVNELTGWTVGGGGKITKTTDGGNSWFLTPFNESAYLTSVFFIDENIGWLIGNNNNYGKIYHTTNSGLSWNEEYNLNNKSFLDIFFIDSMKGWVVGDLGLILNSSGISFLENDYNKILPNVGFLSQNYPNPFNPSTKINWQAPKSGWQKLKVYDVIGNEVATLVNEFRSAGSYEIEFNPSSFNHHTSSGIYFYRLQTGEYVETRKMILLK